MPNPAKSYLQLVNGDKRSHISKAALEMRKEQEESLLTECEIEEFEETAADEVAHQEFVRVTGLLTKIKKNDNLYSGPVNRYALLRKEVLEMQKQREIALNSLEDLSIRREKDDLDMTDKEYYNTCNELNKRILSIESKLDVKRKMQLAIEKELLFTIAAALRSIPKTITKGDDKDNDLFD